MATYDWLFNALGLREWCDASGGEKILDTQSLLRQMMAKQSGDASAEKLSLLETPFPSMNALNDACAAMPRMGDFARSLHEGFIDIRPALRFVLDPLTQPLSWFLTGALEFFTAIPWFIMVPLMLIGSLIISRSWSIVIFFAVSLIILLYLDHYSWTIETLSIITVCTVICVLFGLPIGILMSKSDRLRDIMTPLLDMLQTLPTFVYLIPLIFLFDITEPKLYGVAIILYAIVPVVRLTNLGIRLVDRDVKEAADAFGMSNMQKLFGVEVPLALPNIMAGVNQTIMMSLAMVVIASLVSAPGLGVRVLQGINNNELGVGFLAGAGIVVIAIVLDRVSKAALSRINTSQS